jgi:hypothetical protein
LECANVSRRQARALETPKCNPSCKVVIDKIERDSRRVQLSHHHHHRFTGSQFAIATLRAIAICLVHNTALYTSPRCGHLHYHIYTPETTAAMSAEPPAQPPNDPSSQQQPSQPQHASSETQPPASPPLPQRHTPLTPGPRASMFQDMLNSTLSHTLGKVNYDNFAACYPTIATRAPSTLKAVQKQMVERLGTLCKVCI